MRAGSANPAAPSSATRTRAASSSQRTPRRSSRNRNGASAPGGVSSAGRSTAGGRARIWPSSSGVAGIPENIPPPAIMPPPPPAARPPPPCGGPIRSTVAGAVRSTPAGSPYPGGHSAGVVPSGPGTSAAATTVTGFPVELSISSSNPANCGDRSRSSAAVPMSVTRPRSTRAMRSARSRVLRRCAMISVVRSAVTARRVAWMAASVVGSTALVASSRISSRGSVSNARASASRCRCPPERVSPRSPITVSYPSGSRSMNSAASAARAARWIWSSVASGRP